MCVCVCSHLEQHGPKKRGYKREKGEGWRSNYTRNGNREKEIFVEGGTGRGGIKGDGNNGRSY